MPALHADLHATRILGLFLEGCVNSITTRHFPICLVLLVAAFPFHGVMPRIDSFNVLFTCLTQVTLKLLLAQVGAASSPKAAGTWSFAAVPRGFAYASSLPTAVGNASLTSVS